VASTSTSNLPDRFALAAANATLVCLVSNAGFVLGSTVWSLLTSLNPAVVALPPGLLLALGLLPGVRDLPSQLPWLYLYSFVVVPICSPAIVCAVCNKLNRSGKSIVEKRKLTSAFKLGFWSFLLTCLAIVPTVMIVDKLFDHWSFIYLLSRVWLAQLFYWIAVTLVQLILKAENQFVLSRFCSIVEKAPTRHPVLVCIVSFSIAILIFVGCYYLTPTYLASFFRDPATPIFLFELVAWLLAGLWLVRIMNLGMYMLVYFFCFVVPSFCLFTVMPALMTIISIH
jgi:hypothetical protein